MGTVSGIKHAGDRSQPWQLLNKYLFNTHSSLLKSFKRLFICLSAYALEIEAKTFAPIYILQSLF